MGNVEIRLDLSNGMRITALTNVADESRTMLSGGLAYSSHQWGVGHIGTAVHFLAQIGAAQVGPRSSAPCFFGNAWPACGVEKLSSVDLVDARSGGLLYAVHPLDKSANADGQRRRLDRLGPI